MNASLKSALHHWWPRSLSRFWADDNGNLTRLSWDGSSVCGLPSAFGAIKNAHHIKFQTGTVWDTTFEPVFNVADAQFPQLIEWLLGLDSKFVDARGRYPDRLLAQPLPERLKRMLGECLASLIVRSPNSRHKVKLAAEYYRQRFGFENWEADKVLVAANLRGCYESVVETISAGGKFVALFTDDWEFVFGDGFLHNFRLRAPTSFSLRAIVPLTPNVALIFVKPVEYWTEPQLVTIRLNRREVEFFNDTVQIYSRDEMFFRTCKPRVSSAFSRREFLQYEYDKHPWLECFIEAVARFTPRYPQRA